MKLEHSLQNGTEIIRVLEPRIDAASAIQFKDSVQEVQQGKGDRVILDLSEVKFLDSSGLGAVVAIMKFFAPARKLELAGLTPVVEKVFRLTRMDQVFTIHASLTEGLDAA